jgi:hypothetical protein
MLFIVAVAALLLSGIMVTMLVVDVGTKILAVKAIVEVKMVDLLLAAAGVSRVIGA